VQRLRGFTRTPVAAGATADVAFELGWDELGFWDDANHFVVEPGEFLISVTDGADSERLTLTVTE
jgi:beta-glucosidase